MRAAGGKLHCWINNTDKDTELLKETELITAVTSHEAYYVSSPTGQENEAFGRTPDNACRAYATELPQLFCS